MKKSGRLVNEFSWSFSRRGVFQECQKKYWYTYYGSWEGWPKTPYDQRPSIDPLASHLYMLKQIQTLVQFIGTTVHETLEEALKRRHIDSEELQKKALESFRTGLQDSLSGKWKPAPKKFLNLFEHYFDLPLPP